MMNDVRPQLELVLRRLVEVFVNDLGERPTGPVTTSPMEPLAYESPALWIEGAVFHLGDIVFMGKDVLKSMDVLRSLISGPDAAFVRVPANSSACEESDEELSSDLWGAITDIQFHASYFPLYAANLLELLLNHGIDPMCLRPSLGRYLRKYPPAGKGFSDKVAGLLASPTIPAPLARTISRDLAELERACKVTLAAVEDLISDDRGDFAVLAQRFANIYAAVLSLGSVLLRAEASSTIMLHEVEVYYTPNPPQPDAAKQTTIAEQRGQT
jgi:hypothetical protein